VHCLVVCIPYRAKLSFCVDKTLNISQKKQPCSGYIDGLNNDVHVEHSIYCCAKFVTKRRCCELVIVIRANMSQIAVSIERLKYRIQYGPNTPYVCLMYFSGKFLLTYCDQGLFVINPTDVQVVLWTTSIRGVFSFRL